MNNGSSGGSLPQGFYSLHELLVRTLQGLGRPLRMRILQLLETHASSLDTLYALADLLVFYQETFWRLVPLENAVHSALRGAFAECERIFLQQVRRHAESVRLNSAQLSLSSSTGAANGSSANSSGANGGAHHHRVDLKASVVTRDCAQQVKGILKAASMALSSLPFGGNNNSVGSGADIYYDSGGRYHGRSSVTSPKPGNANGRMWKAFLERNGYNARETGRGGRLFQSLVSIL